MPVALATGLVYALLAYLGAGLLFAAVFVFTGIATIDPVAAGSTRGFRIIVIPGVAALWPLLAWRWLRGVRRPPEENNAHRTLAGRSSR